MMDCLDEIGKLISKEKGCGILSCGLFFIGTNKHKQNKLKISQLSLMLSLGTGRM